MKRVLFICRFLPHPNARDSGGQDVYHYIDILRKHHLVSLIAFVTPDQEVALTSMRHVCEEVIAVPYRHNAFLPRLWRAWWRLWLPRVYGRVFSLRYRRYLRALLSHRHFDVVFVEGMMAQYGKMLQGTKRILDEIDIYSTVAYQMYRNEKRFLSRLWAMMDWMRLQALELHYVNLYDEVVVRSTKDQEFLRSFLPSQRIRILPPWFEGLSELRQIPIVRPPGNILLFMGAMNLPANIEAILFFAREVLPLIRQQVPDVKLYIVGSSPTPSVQRLANVSHIIVTGEVDRLSPYYEHCAVNVVPLLRGGGVIVKTLNGLAAGRPTVATPAGNSGTGARPGRDLIVADPSPDAFAEAVVALLTDERLWYKIAESGRRYVADNYYWEKVVRTLEDLVSEPPTPHV